MSRQRTTRPRSHCHHRQQPVPAPFAGIDPIDNPATALALFELAAPQPPAPETVIVAVDDRGLGSTLIRITGRDNGAFARAVDVVSEACADSPYRRLIAASFRPGEEPVYADVQQWYDAVDQAMWNGCELIEWFVIGTDSAWAMGQMLDDRSRWQAE